MPRTTIRFNDDRWWAQGRLLKGFAVAAALSVAGWQFAKWWENPIEHEGVKPADNHVIIGDRKVSDPFAALMNGMGVREGEGATLGTQSFAEAYERTKERADQVDPRTVAREAEAKNILESYNQFLQTQPQPVQKYEFLKSLDGATLLGVHHNELGENADLLFQLFRQSARDTFAELRLQALREANFDYYRPMLSASLDSFNSVMDPDAQKYMDMMQEAQKEIDERRKQFKPAPE